MGITSSEELFLPNNTLMPTGISITEGYDAMHPHGMRSPTGQKWDFPGTTHFFGQIFTPHPESWRLVWKDGKWGLWRNPAPSVGRLFLDHESSFTPLTPDRHHRPTSNTMEVCLPAGTKRVEIFCNWKRGWFWKLRGQREWQETIIGDNRSLGLNLPQPLVDETVVEFRYRPTPPSYVLGISLFCLLISIVIGLFGVPRQPRSLRSIIKV